MTIPHLILTVALINLIGTMSPGPSFVIVAQNALKYSRKSGLYTALGIVLADLIHISYCLLGIATLISKSILLFNVIKYLGAIYLLYLGIKAIRNKSTIELSTTKSKKELSNIQAFKEGLLVTLLNPKATLLFLSIFTVTIPAGTPAYAMITMGAIMLLSIWAWYSIVAVFFTQNKVRSVFLKFQNVFNKVFGGLLIALGLKVALSEN